MDIIIFNICFICSIFTFISGVISALVSKINLFIIFMWLAFFFGGAIVPILTGIIITSLPKHLRASGNSLQLFIGTLLGYLPAPYIYGVLEDYFEDGGKKSYFFNMSFLFICVILLGNSKRIKYENSHSSSNDNENDNINNELNPNFEINGQNYEEIPTQ